MIGLGDLDLPQGEQNAGLGDLGAALANMSCISIGCMEDKEPGVDHGATDAIFPSQPQPDHVVQQDILQVGPTLIAPPLPQT